MSATTLFYPSHRFGLIFHAIAILALVVGGAWSLWQATQAEVGPTFLLYLLPTLLALAIVPVLAYRAYALWRASYSLERDGIRLRWGLREEVIPMDVVGWVRPASEVGFSLPLPRVRWPGAVLGVRRLPDGGQVEYLAAQTGQLILIAAFGRVFAISPAAPDEFLRTYHRLSELGSLTPLPARSLHPAFLLARVWASKPARYLLLGGLILSLGLLVMVSLLVPSRPAISLGFNPDGTPTDLVPSVRMLLLPFLNSFFYLADLLAGLFFYRREGGQALAFLLWGSGVLTATFFLGAVIFIQGTG